MSADHLPQDPIAKVDAMVLDHPDHCVACHSCELACSYHHLGLFQPSRASVCIERVADSGTITRRRYYSVHEARVACDLCVGEPELQCEKYCSRSAVRQIFENRRRNRNAGAADTAAEGDDAAE